MFVCGRLFWPPAHGVFIGNDGLAVVGETEDAALLLAGFDFVVSIDARGVDGDA